MYDDSDPETSQAQRESQGTVTSDAMIMPSPALNAAQRYAQGMERKGWVAIDLDSFCKGKPYTKEPLGKMVMETFMVSTL